MSGAALQGLLRNPLADPGILGISGSAVLGAVLMMYFFASSALSVWVPVAGMGFALGALWAVLALVGRRPDALWIILAGAAINALTAALLTLALNLALNPFAVQDVVFWMMGGFDSRTLMHAGMVALPVLAGIGLIVSQRRALDVLTLGPEAAHSLGVEVARVQRKVVIGTALSVGAVVSVCGGIGFVGLVVPHLVRPLVGWKPGATLWPSALAGALLTLLADLLVRALPLATELKVGVITALIGTPFFLWLILKGRSRWQA
ncbi:MAG: iron ABC transporter permease [Gammaproteobacteria bacterium]|nr:MAG: iron ABC transporter permease [Gammaproteobacteria bacterium]